MTDPQLVVVAPCFNEGEVAVRFVRELAGTLAAMPVRSLILMVDDASTDDTLARLQALGPSIDAVGLQVVALDRNMGHQGAIYQGLRHAFSTQAERFIVMDSDGEDDPAVIPAMAAVGDASIVLVARGKRNEGLAFRLGYFLYKRMFRIVTRRSITFGNYSLVDRRTLRAVLDRGFVHYAAFLSRQRVPMRTITADRRPRLDGRSKMSMGSLSVHAFRSLMEYSEDVLSLFLKAFFALAIAAVLAIVVIVCIKLFTDLAIPGWASTLTVSLLNAMLVCLGFFSVGLLLVSEQGRRENAGRPFFRDRDAH